MYFDNDEWHSSFDGNFVSPQSLMRTANTPGQPVREVAKSNMSMACLLVPGGRYRLSPTNEPMPTAETIINRKHAAEMRAYKENLDYVTIVPRLPQHSAVKDVETIVFSCKGRPGVYLHQLDTARIDNPNDSVFRAMGWKRTRVQVDWPGIERIGRLCNLPCLPGQGFYTRQEVALEVGRQVQEVLLPHSVSRNNYTRQELNKHTRRWDIRSIDYRSVRLLGINYYQNWVPVLAIDDPDIAPETYH